MRKYFIFAGELSGDLHGSRLIRALREQETDCQIFGVGGPAMRHEGFECLIPMEEFQVMGFSAVFKSLPKLCKHFFRIRDYLLREKPDAVILIDYPGFNLRLARTLRKKGFTGKLIQYICPSVWAHGKKRIKTLATTLDLLLTIYPFESSYFSSTDLRVRYIGNPLAETIRTHIYDVNWDVKCGLATNRSRPLIALFPGSRVQEIKQNLPIQLQAAEQLKKSDPHVIFAVSFSQEKLLDPIKECLEQSTLRMCIDFFLIPKAYTYELMRACQIALAKSGTVTLELALHAKPSVVMYQIGRLNYWIAKHVLKLKLPHYCIVNILNQNETFPECIEKVVSVTRLSEKLHALYENAPLRQKISNECIALQQQLGHMNTSHCAAKEIMSLFTC